MSGGSGDGGGDIAPAAWVRSESAVRLLLTKIQAGFCEEAESEYLIGLFFGGISSGSK